MKTPPNPNQQWFPASAGGESLPGYSARQRLFLKGGESTLAISKERKQQMVEEYVDWIHRSQALIVMEYTGLTMKQVDDLRSKIRETGGEFHIVKNTLGKVAFQQAGWETPAAMFEGSTAISFAFKDAPATAKTINEFIRTSEFIKVKGGYLDQHPISAAEVKALAELPPLPVVRAQLLGTLLAPASKLVRTL
ncbi:MAG: 50S ribosomal protein L10, partial [Anaerolineales bacterium]|nr:50S ribosomal protein L10 [Anaerolineales bacterium]